MRQALHSFLLTYSTISQSIANKVVNLFVLWNMLARDPTGTVYHITNPFSPLPDLCGPAVDFSYFVQEAATTSSYRLPHRDELQPTQFPTNVDTSNSEDELLKQALMLLEWLAQELTPTI